MTQKSNKTWNLTLSSRLFLLCGLMLASSVVATAITLFAMQQRRSNAAQFNLAGRQRMLTQRVAKEFLDEQNTKQVSASAEKLAASIARQITIDRMYYTKNVIGKLKKESPSFKAGANYHEVLGSIPLPATYVREVAESHGDASGYRADLLSKWPVNPKKGLTNELQQRAWNALEADPQTPYQEIVANGEGSDLHYFTADVAAVQGCVSCHNKLPNSPKTDFVLNDLMGVLVVSVSVATDSDFAAQLLASDSQSAWRKSRDLFAATLAALRNGGETFTDLAMTQPTTLSAVKSDEVQATLKETQAHWDSVQLAASGVQNSEINSQEYLTHLQTFRDATAHCLRTMNKACALLEATSNAGISRTIFAQYIAIAISFSLFVAVMFYIRRKVVKPLKDALHLANAVALGDLTQTCATVTTDEVGQLSEALNKMNVDLLATVESISGLAGSLGSSSQDLSDKAAQMADKSGEVSTQSSTVASAAEEMSTNMTNMSASTEKMPSAATHN
jgi:HAMP domain-containing protein